jgi:hypothetical protein
MNFKAGNKSSEEFRLPGCYAVWLLLQEPHGVTYQKTVFFTVTAMKTLNLSRVANVLV